MGKLIAGAVLALLASPALACADVGPAFDVRADFSGSTAVVAATAEYVSVAQRPPDLSENELYFAPQTVAWRVNESWKGPFEKGDWVSITTPLGPCTRAVREREVLVLFLDRDRAGNFRYRHVAELADNLPWVSVLYALAHPKPGT